MDPESYLTLLASRLADGVARLPEATRVRHAAYLGAAQNADGGFSGREGGSDLYYTGFALRGLSVLDALTPEICEKAAGFLRHSLTQSASVVDFFSLLYACLLVQASGGPDVLANSPEDWPERTAATLETFRTADGGYTKTPGGASGSTYHTFLVGLCYELLGKALPNPAEIVRFTSSRRRDDGGFVEIAPMRRGGTNPTAAAVGLLQLTGSDGAALLTEVRDGVADFLAEMASPEGGLRANGRAPLADLLSTFTASWTLYQLGALERIDGDEVKAFAEAAELPNGGFHGGIWDEGWDVEYTFYGLGVMGLLSVD
jgi:geranylgeranyl transferase type-2 subunit beta